MHEYRIGFIGFGHMAQILFSAIDRTKMIPRSHILFHRRDPAKSKKNEQDFKVTATSLKNLVEQSQVVLLCVRPHQAEGILKELRAFHFQKPIISILAGVKISLFERILGNDVQIVRAMPNLASSINQGMTVLSYNSQCRSEFKSFTQLFFGAMGEMIELSEHLMDISCAISGSGPGFVFRLIETMAKTGEKHGIPFQDALKMSAQVFLGASKLILNGASPADLLVQIATPNGTTEAGLSTMRQTEMDQHFQKVIEASAERSKEL